MELSRIKKIFHRMQAYYIKHFQRSVFFRIIDHKNDIYVLQCAHSKAILNTSLLEMISNLNILYSLHPVQACFVGLEYSKLLRKNTILQYPSYEVANHYAFSEFKIQFQDRNGDICYLETATQKKYLFSPQKIAASKEMIEKFNAPQAFYIGVCAGLKIHRAASNVHYLGGQKEC